MVAIVLPREQWPEELRKELTEAVHEDGPVTITELIDPPIAVT